MEPALSDMHFDLDGKLRATATSCADGEGITVTDRAIIRCLDDGGQIDAEDIILRQNVLR